MRRWHPMGPAALLCCAVCGGTALAAPPSFELRWTAPLGCPTGEQLVRRVERELDDPEGSAVTGVDGAIIPNGDGFRLDLRLRVHGEQLVRSVEADSCDGLADAAALLVAMAVEEGAVEGEQPPAEDPAAEDPASEQPVHPGPPWQTRAWAGVALVVEHGGLPGSAAGPSVFAGVSHGPLSLSLDGVYLPPQGERATTPSSVAEADLIAVGAQPCFAVLRGRFTLRACVRGELGRYRGRSTGVSQPRTDSVVWLAGGGGLDGQLRLGAGWKLHLAPTLMLPAARHALVLRTAAGPVEVFRSAALSWRATMGIAYTFLGP